MPLPAHSSFPPVTDRNVSDDRIHLRRGFTLVELLAVLAIVGILAAIIIPIAGNVRENARASQCMSNLRQIGMAMNLYAQSNKGLLPAPRAVGGDWYNDVWMTAIQPYLEDRKPVISDLRGKRAALWDGVFRCPSKPDWNLDGTSDIQRVSYSMASYGNDIVAVNTARRLNEFAKPAITALVVDSNTGTVFMRNPAYMYRDFTALWHKGRDQVLFVDGHVEPVSKNGLNYYLVKSTKYDEQPW